MNRRFASLLSLVLGFAGIVFLLTIDMSERLDTDVSNMLPNDESPEARILRNLITEKQGRIVYLAIDLPETRPSQIERIRETALESLSESAIIERIVDINDRGNLEAYQSFLDGRFPLLFPKWFARNLKEYESESRSGTSFEEWASRQAAEKLDSFLASPIAMEIARPELIDPLLLAIGAIESIGQEPLQEAHKNSGILFWIELSVSPLSPETQIALSQLVEDTSETLGRIAPSISIEYGGLTRLAQASRERIHSDIGRINTLSFAGVLMVSLLLVRPPWRLVLALPAILLAFICAASVSLLLFSKINVIVVIIGSILIGTSIDYAFHVLFAKPEKANFPTGKLIFLACLSTIVGFGILLLSDMLLIKQIGVFVASGLIAAYIASQALPKPKDTNRAPSYLATFAIPRRLAIVALVAICVLVGERLWNMDMLNWNDSIRNLEAPNPDIVSKDLALRKRFGQEQGKQAIISIGNSFVSALQSQHNLISALEAKGHVLDKGLIPSRLLPTQGEIELLSNHEGNLKDLFDSLGNALEEFGYEKAAFNEFFEEAYKIDTSSISDVAADSIREFSDSLEGPSSSMLSSDEDLYWTFVALNLESDAISDPIFDNARSFKIEQLASLNQNLNTLRSQLGKYGLYALAAVITIVLLAFGTSRGMRVILLPLVSGIIAIALASHIFIELNLFHLIGCFLGGAIALDYALFGIEAQKKSHEIPYSVWLSSATTSASFLALTSSYIIAVRSLGFMVAAMTISTILLLLTFNSFFENRAKSS